MSKKLYLNSGLILLPALALAFSFGLGCNSNKNDSAIKPDATPTASTSSATGGAERMVLDNAQVTVYIECTNREYKQYKFRFVVKKPGSPFIAPIVRMAGNPDVHSILVNGVDSDTVGFAFSPNIAVFDKNLEAVTATYNTRTLNSNDALGDAYHDLVLKYEKGN